MKFWKQQRSADLENWWDRASGLKRNQKTCCSQVSWLFWTLNNNLLLYLIIMNWFLALLFSTHQKGNTSWAAIKRVNNSHGIQGWTAGLLAFAETRELPTVGNATLQSSHYSATLKCYVLHVPQWNFCKRTERVLTGSQGAGIPHRPHVNLAIVTMRER